ARAAREHGLLNQAMQDPSAFAAAYEAKRGRAMPAETRARMTMLSSIAAALRDPAPVVANPDGFLDRLEAESGKPLSADDRAKAKEWIANVAGQLATSTDPSAGATVTGAAADSVAPIGSSTADYIPAIRARSLPAAFLLGPLLQKYALRHGWVRGMPLFARIKWRAIGVVEVLVGLVVAAIGSSAQVNAVVALGLGTAAGGVATYLIAPSMPSVSIEGSVMRAQLAAYRRTLQASLAQATSLRDVATASRLTWLETPDQTVVWAIALGLRKELEAFFRRSPEETGESFALGAGSSAAVSTSTGSGDPAAMFAGIELIGTAIRERGSPWRSGSARERPS